ncbi:MAG: hypothetical protein U9O49_02330, partial [Candidatus Thermoplasmatota archaeon]|nr:hypothetical protein [Candidatus Thermoplasmatota archaeon]
ENELRHYANIEAGSDEEIINAAVLLKEKISARLDLHTSDFTCTVTDKCIVVPTSDIAKKRRSTGAGDTWNAGNIFGDLLGFSDDERLFFANCVAGCYISSLQPNHPTIDAVIGFISNL